MLLIGLGLWFRLRSGFRLGYVIVKVRVRVQVRAFGC